MVQTDLARSFVESTPGRTPYLGPVWLIEGSAYYAELRLTLSADSFRSRLSAEWANARQTAYALRCLEDGSAYFSTKASPYRLGAVAVDLLISRSGQQSLLNYWGLFARGAYWKNAFGSAFGMTVESFYAEYDRARFGNTAIAANC